MATQVVHLNVVLATRKLCVTYFILNFNIQKNVTVSSLLLAGNIFVLHDYYFFLVFQFTSSEQNSHCLALRQGGSV